MQRVLLPDQKCAGQDAGMSRRRGSRGANRARGLRHGAQRGGVWATGINLTAATRTASCLAPFAALHPLAFRGR